jgi:putative protease
LPYELIVDGQPRDLGDRAYLLSPQDLAAYNHMAELIDAGVISFKIEGRLKGGPYVAATTRLYRQAIDAAVADRPPAFSREDELDVAQTFSRGFVPGYLEGVNHQRLVRGRFPKSRGVRLGRVQSVGTHSVRVALAETVPEFVKPGDGVLFDLGTPEVAEPGGRVWRVSDRPSRVDEPLVELFFPPDALNFAAIPVGCEVWKTDDPALRKRLEQTYSQDKLVHRHGITATLGGQLGGPVVLELRADSRTATATWPGPLELARKHPTSDADIREQISRLGETPFELTELVCELPAGVMLPRSVLNELRRQAATELMTQVLTRQHPAQSGLAALRAESGSVSVASPATPPNLTVLVRNLTQLDAMLSVRPAVVYADFEDARGYAEAVRRAKDAGVRLGVAPLRIWKPGEDGFQSLIVRANPEMVLVRNLGSIAYFREQLPHATLVGDFSLNVANDLTARLLWQQKLVRLVPSFDLNWEQFTALMQHADATQFECVIHQHMPMFHNEFCVFAAFLSNGKDHTDCGRPCETHTLSLRDRVGATFPVLPDTGCRNTVFNSVAQSAAEYVGRMKHLGLQWFRLDLLRETPDEAWALWERYRRVIEGRDDGRQTWKQLRVLNQLGVTRGTLNQSEA